MSPGSIDLLGVRRSRGPPVHDATKKHTGLDSNVLGLEPLAVAAPVRRTARRSIGIDRAARRSRRHDRWRRCRPASVSLTTPKRGCRSASSPAARSFGRGICTAGARRDARSKPKRSSMRSPCAPKPSVRSVNRGVRFAMTPMRGIARRRSDADITRADGRGDSAAGAGLGQCGQPAPGPRHPAGERNRGALRAGRRARRARSARC